MSDINALTLKSETDVMGVLSLFDHDPVVSSGRSEDEDDGHEATTTIKNFKLLSSFRGLSENTFMIFAVKIFNVC
jgi:hypothetical protein